MIDPPLPLPTDPASRVAQAALAVAEELLTQAAERGECPLCGWGAGPDGIAPEHAPGCVLVAYTALTAGVSAPPVTPTRYVLVPVFLAGEVEQFAAAAQRLTAMAREMEDMGTHLHGQIEMATHHLLRQSRRSTRFTQTPLYPTPWPGEGPAVTKRRQRNAKEAAG